MQPQPSSPGPLAAGITIIGVLIAIALVVALWRVGSGMQQQACVAKAEARYPAVPVSAFNTRTTGPLKLSYITERAKAVQDC